MTQFDLDLAELLCARLCHDMAGPVGAAAAGAELLEDSPDPETAAMVATSAAGAVARLKFLRTAFGPAGSPQPPEVIRDLAAGYLRSAATGGAGGLRLAWTCRPAPLDGESARLVLNLILIARDGLPRGGEIRVEIDETLRVGLFGPGAGLSEDVRQALTAGKPPAGPREAQAGLAARLAFKLRGFPQLEAVDGGVFMTV